MVLAESQVPPASTSENVCFSALSVCTDSKELIIHPPGTSVLRGGLSTSSTSSCLVRAFTHRWDRFGQFGKRVEIMATSSWDQCH